MSKENVAKVAGRNVPFEPSPALNEAVLESVPGGQPLFTRQVSIGNSTISENLKGEESIRHILCSTQSRDGCSIHHEGDVVSSPVAVADH